MLPAWPISAGLVVCGHSPVPDFVH